MAEQVLIRRRFRGPPDSANGGYACGTVARFVEGDPAVEVTLRAPPPLDTQLAIELVEGGAELRDGETLLAEGRPAPAPVLDMPQPVTLEQAEEARGDSPFLEHHMYPMCFVCGPERRAGDGLQVICGPVSGRENELLAAPWDVDGDLAADDGSVPTEFVWSVLDCPGGLAGWLVPGVGVTMLGRLTGVIRGRVEPGDSYVAIGWPIAREGRKLYAGSAILDRSGEPLAYARATWIELKEPSS